MSAQPSTYEAQGQQWHASWQAAPPAQPADYSAYANYYNYQAQPAAQPYYAAPPEQPPAAAAEAPPPAESQPPAAAAAETEAPPMPSSAPPAVPPTPAAPPPPLPNAAAAPATAPPPATTQTTDPSQIPGLGDQQPTDQQQAYSQYYNSYYQQYGQYSYQYPPGSYYSYPGYNYDTSSYQQGAQPYQQPAAYPPTAGSYTQYQQQPQATDPQAQTQPPAAEATAATTGTETTQDAYTYSYTNTPYAYPSYTQDPATAAQQAATVSTSAPAPTSYYQQYTHQHQPTYSQQSAAAYPAASTATDAVWNYSSQAAQTAAPAAQPVQQTQTPSLPPHVTPAPASSNYIKPNNSIVKTVPHAQNSNSTGTTPAAPRAAGAAAKPAYLSVAQSQSKPAENATTSSAPAAPAKPAATSTAQKWPPSLHSFVERAFQTCRDDPSRQDMQVQLVTIIKEATEKGELWTKNWDEMRVPGTRKDEADDSPSWGKSGSQASRWNAYASKYGNAGGNKGTRGEKHGKTWEAGGGGSGGKNKQGQHGKNNKKGKNQEGNNKRWRKDNYEEEEDDSNYNPPVGSDQFKRQCRTARFGDGKAAPLVQASAGPVATLPPKSRSAGSRYDWDAADSDDDDWTEGEAVKGTCTSLEKSYFRLTGAPNPTTIRPPPVLQQALDRLIQLLKTKQVNYFYAQDQFKAMRQDLTVQRVRNELAVAVYEAHGRAAAEYGDMGDFNQCQTQLTILYSEGLPGAKAEFMAYRLLYNTAHGARTKQQLLNAMKGIPAEMYSDPVVAHALKVRQAVFSADAPAFFTLYETAPLLLRAFMDLVVRKLRFTALTSLVKSYRPTLPVPFIARILGFVQRRGALDTDNGGNSVGPNRPGAGGKKGNTLIAGEIAPGCSSEVFAGASAAMDSLEDGCEACLQWLETCQATIQLEKGAAAEAAVVDCKLSVNTIQLPPEQNKVAHGDANLAITDFLARAIGN